MSEHEIPQSVIDAMAQIRPGMSTEEALEDFGQPADLTPDGEDGECE